MKTAVYQHPAFRNHVPPKGHPDLVERLDMIEAALRALPTGCRLVTSERVASVAETTLVHDPAYVSGLLALRGRSASLDHETFVAPGSLDAALRAAGTCLDMVEALSQGTIQAGFALVRPPGHHATPVRGMGYCLLNNVAIAASHARSLGLERVMILDWDAHLGNGTQAAFRDDPGVLVVDLHQEHLFPQGGDVSESGTGPGSGYTVNVPLPSGSTASDYVRVLVDVVEPIARWYRPRLLLVSCGFDAAAGDPEAGMDVAPAGYFDMTAVAAGIAARHAGGRIGLVLEGGYGLKTLGACARHTLDALVSAPLPEGAAAAIANVAATPPVDRVIEAVRRQVRSALPIDFQGKAAS